MIMCYQGDDFKTEQCVVIDFFIRIDFSDDGDVGAMLIQQAYRIGLEARHDVQLDFGPAAAEYIHGWH